jgi:general secretion pathway protein A
MACYARNENVVLIIDEAQNLDPKLLEEVRLLTNLETPKSKLLQVILMGQPELDGILNRPQFRQLKQRVSLRYYMQPLNEEEMKAYIKRRLRIAGAMDPNIFTTKAVKEIYRYSKGIPRLINIVCDNALLTGYANDQKIIGDRIIHEVISNLNGLGHLRGKSKRSTLFKVMFYALPILVVFIILLGTGSIPKVKLDFTEWIQTFKKFIENLYYRIW